MAHSHGWHVHIGCWQDGSVFHHTDFSTGLLECPYDMAASFPHPRGREKKQGGSHNVFYDLTREVTLHHFGNILLVSQVSPIPRGKDYIGERQPGDKNHCGPSRRLAATLSHRVSEDEICEYK